MTPRSIRRAGGGCRLRFGAGRGMIVFVVQDKFSGFLRLMPTGITYLLSVKFPYEWANPRCLGRHVGKLFIWEFCV